MTEAVNILLVDDEVRNLDVLESILQSPDYRLVRAQKAEDALLRLLEMDFAVIVLDIQMPGMTGIELANLVKERKRTAHIPIIFLTAYFHEDKDILQGYEVGAVDYLTKPLNSQILKSKIAVFVDLFRKTRALTASNAALELEVAERQKAEDALRQANNELETRVRERTAELSRANRELRISEERYRLILENALEYAIFTMDRGGHVKSWNAGAQRILGFAEAEIVGQRLDLIFTAEDREKGQLDLEMGRALTNGRAQDERWHLRKDGSPFWASGLMMPLKDEDGLHLGFLKILRDGTARKQAEDALRESEARFRNMADSAPVLIWIADTTKVCTWFNQRWLEFVGRPLEKEIGDGWAENVHPKDLARCVKTYVESFDARREFEMEYRLRRHDGEFRWVLDHGTPMYDPARKFTGYIGSCIDITELKHAQETLRESEARLSAASRAKDDFLATLSHELRTPLSPVLLLASEGAANPQLPDNVRADFNTIRKNVELEARLIDDLLDLTRIARGKLALDHRAQNVHAILQDAIENARADLEQKRIDLVVDLTAENGVILGDDVRLQQIFWNVLSNAVKFTPEGGTVTVESRASADGDRLSVRIADTGIGMTPEEIERVFEAFSQGDHAAQNSSNQFGGIGLGLAISRMLVELQHGTIRAFSAGRDQGSAFVMEFPLLPATEANDSSLSTGALISEAAPSQRAEALGRQRILLVEDHEPTRETLAHLLSRRKFEVVTAGSVAEARALAEQQPFDLLISDIGLPDGNGYDLMTYLGNGHRLKGIALTGYGMEADIARSKAAGFMAHLTKPVRVQSLDSVLAAAANAAPAP